MAPNFQALMTVPVLITQSRQCGIVHCPVAAANVQAFALDARPPAVISGCPPSFPQVVASDRHWRSPVTRTCMHVCMYVCVCMPHTFVAAVSSPS